ncbi:MAG: adenine phosphoribosyltransferase [Firmicutes bacterium]|nr:adenine phosphoribosyltransferase [Bacillota bacterium]
MNNFHKIKILGETRSLPLIKIDNIQIFGFDSVGDMDIILKGAKKLHKFIGDAEGSVPKPDLILTTEVKGIPLAQELARLLDINYIVLRKSQKIYMGETISIKGGSITSGESDYYLSKTNFERLKNKNILFVDDVYSTGKTMDTITELCKQTSSNFIQAVFILQEVMNGEDKDAIVHFSHNNIKCTACGTLKCTLI